MAAVELTRSWPVPTVAAAVVAADGSVHDSIGPTDRPFRLASLSKLFTAWAVLIAVEEGTVFLDQPVGQPGCTLGHLLAHAGGYPFEGAEPIAAPETRRIYSNTGFELAADAVSKSCGFSFDTYLTEGLLDPLGLRSTTLHGSPAHGVHGTVDDMVTFLSELQRPQLLSRETAESATRPHYPELAGIVPGMGRFDPCPWGLGMELKGEKAPHWTGRTNSSATFGHFGGSGTMTWVDPVAGAGLVALTDRPFDEWAADARVLWSELSDAVVEELTAR
jgi:CubicO group peptidase (beta-lactamase class C family)